MVFFRVSENINIKTTDGTLVKYIKSPKVNLDDEFIYCSTYSDFLDLNNVFARVDKKYKNRILLESKILNTRTLPLELGISNKFEYQALKKFDLRVKNASFINKQDLSKIKEISFDEKKIDFFSQISKVKKDEISLAIIGGIGSLIGEIVAASSALRILYEELKKSFEKVNLDIFLQASENKYYSRDKELLLLQKYVNKVEPLALNLKELLSYDFFIDNSLLQDRTYYKSLPYVDAYLYKFGLDYKLISEDRKNVNFDNINFKINKTLINKIKKIKKVSKLLLFHPFTASEDRSIPKNFAVKYLKNLINQADDYLVISTLNITQINDDRYVDLSQDSKNISDYIYIISCADKIITADTATYHIADAFFIPTVVLFTQNNALLRCKYYKFTKFFTLEDESQNYSSFIFANESLKLHNFKAWEKLKMKKVIELLETI